MKAKSRSNSRLNCDIKHIARLYAASNLKTEAELNTSQLILQSISDRQYGRAKLMLDDFVRPEFGSPEVYFRRKQFSALLAKVPFAGDNSARKFRAIESFYDSEARCKRVNKKLAHFLKYPNRMPDSIRVILSRTRGVIRQVLGRLDEDRLEQIYAHARPGSGVAIGTQNRYRVSLPYKLAYTDLTTTARAYPYAQALVEGSPYWLQLNAEPGDAGWFTLPYNLATGNRFTFVPKDARTLRTIAIEPALNVCLQLGVHSHIAERLKSFGNDIENQSRNQKLARIGSIRPFGRSLATLDLSSASDTVSTELVRTLLPSDWFGLLDDFRCHSGDLQGALIHLEKFSSMGNGFTFALETLIFWAIAKAVSSYTGSGSHPSCYGDDIITADEDAAILTETLNWCGFVINHDKSYYLGSFRESCGADWHSGFRVTPQYVRKAVLRPTDVYLFLNRVDPCFNWVNVRDYLLSCHREKEPVLYGLECEDDSSCLFTSFDYVNGGGMLKWSPDWQSYTFKSWRFVPEVESVPPLVGLAAALLGSRSAVFKHAKYQLRGRGSFRLRSSTPGRQLDVPRFHVG